MEYYHTNIVANCSSFDQPNCTSNLTSDEIVFVKVPYELKLYPIPTFWVVTLFIAYGAIFLISLVGNVLVLWLVLASSRMRTVTNTFICNLAAVDLVISILIVPMHLQAALLQRWDIPHFLCPIYPFAQVISVQVSVFTLTAIALQRYGAVVYPLQISIAKWTPAIVVVCIWPTSFGISIPIFMDYSVKIYHNAEIAPFCENQYFSKTFKWFYYQFLVLVQYILPLLIMSLAYRKTAQKLWSEVTPGVSEQNRDAAILNKKQKVTKMMVIVVMMFAVCWFPYQAYNILQVYFPNINNLYYINIIWLWINWLAMSNYCVNPFIYAILNEKFQDELKRRWRHRRGTDSEDADNAIIAMVVQNVQIPELLVCPQAALPIEGLDGEMIPVNVGSIRELMNA